MKKTLFTLLFLTASVYSYAQFGIPQYADSCLVITMQCTDVDTSANGTGVHRAPSQTPTILLNPYTRTLYFTSPCYGLELELRYYQSESVVYSYLIPDGSFTATLPEEFYGSFELHLHNGSRCYYGFIEL